MFYAGYSHKGVDSKDGWQIHLFENKDDRDIYVKAHKGFKVFSRDNARKIGIPKKDKAIKYGWYH